MEIGITTMYQTRNVSKTLNEKLLFQNVNLSLDKGDICCLYGDNGAGKSVFIDCMLGFQPLDEGEILFEGRVIEGREPLKCNTGIVSVDHQSFLENLTAREYFSLTMEVFELDNEKNDALLFMLIDRFGLTEHLDSLFNELSFGTKKKVQLIGNLIYSPLLLVCDEIFEGLDANGVEEVKKVFKERSQEGLITFYTTHISQESQGVSNKNLYLRDKKILLNGDAK